MRWEQLTRRGERVAIAVTVFATLVVSALFFVLATVAAPAGGWR